MSSLGIGSKKTGRSRFASQESKRMLWSVITRSVSDEVISRDWAHTSFAMINKPTSFWLIVESGRLEVKRV